MARRFWVPERELRRWGGAPQAAGRVPGSAGHSVLSLQEEAKAKEEEGVPDEEGWVKVTRRGRRPVLPRTEAASLRVLDRERRKRARKELLNFYAWQHRESKMERKGGARVSCFSPVRSAGLPRAPLGRGCGVGGGVPWTQTSQQALESGSQPAASPAAVPLLLPATAVGALSC